MCVPPTCRDITNSAIVERKGVLYMTAMPRGDDAAFPSAVQSRSKTSSDAHTQQVHVLPGSSGTRAPEMVEAAGLKGLRPIGPCRPEASASFESVGATSVAVLCGNIPIGQHSLLRQLTL